MVENNVPRCVLGWTYVYNLDGEKRCWIAVLQTEQPNGASCPWENVLLAEKRHLDCAVKDAARHIGDATIRKAYTSLNLNHFSHPSQHQKNRDIIRTNDERKPLIGLEFVVMPVAILDMDTGLNTLYRSCHGTNAIRFVHAHRMSEIVDHPVVLQAVRILLNHPRYHQIVRSCRLTIRPSVEGTHVVI